MCIISFYKYDNQIILTHNRDENISRIASSTVEERIWNKKTFFSPVDKEKNGTWIFYNEQYIACILNGGKEKPKEIKFNYRISRGIILLNLMNYHSVEDFISLENLSDAAPFTIFVFERVSKKTLLLFWDGYKLDVNDLTDSNFIFRASSTLYSFEKMHELEKKITKFSKPSAETIFTQHQAVAMKAGDVEQDKATTSITQIIADSSSIYMKYCPFQSI